MPSTPDLLPPPQTPEATGAPEGPYAIETEGLTKRYGDHAAVDGLSIKVPQGQVIGFVGPNGAGKTTTMRMLLGLIRPSAGTARVLGVPIDEPTRFLPRVGALIESPAFYAHLSGRANLEALCLLGGHPRRRVDEALDRVGLKGRADEAYKRYSLGMKQRLGIAAALLPDPDLLVLDEPTNGLDPSGIREMREFLGNLGREGKTVFVSSHLLSEIQKMCEHVVMIRKGRLVFQGTVRGLLEQGTGVRLAATDRRRHATLARLLEDAGYQVDRTPEHLVVRGAGRKLAAAINRAASRRGIVLEELHVLDVDLEQTFLAMTGRSEP